jgi:intracellular multiplication protein IcmD
MMFYFNLGKKAKIMISVLLLFSIYMVMATHAYATAGGDDVSGLPDKVAGLFDSVLTILRYLAYTAGVFFIFASLFKFDQHKKNPTQIPMSQPLTLFAIGAALLVLPTIIKYAGAGGKDADNKSMAIKKK